MSAQKRTPKYKKRTLVGYKEYLVIKTIEELEEENKKKGTNEPIYYTRINERLKGKVVWAYIVKILKKHAKIGTIEVSEAGKVKLLKLTDKGREYLRCVERIMELLNFNPNE